MEILVCIKQVADDSVEVFMNEKTGKPAKNPLKWTFFPLFLL